jgi:hypothetical protein
LGRPQSSDHPSPLSAFHFPANPISSFPTHL